MPRLLPAACLLAVALLVGPASALTLNVSKSLEFTQNAWHGNPHLPEDANCTGCVCVCVCVFCFRLLLPVYVCLLHRLVLCSSVCVCVCVCARMGTAWGGALCVRVCAPTCVYASCSVRGPTNPYPPPPLMSPPFTHPPRSLWSVRACQDKHPGQHLVVLGASTRPHATTPLLPLPSTQLHCTAPHLATPPHAHAAPHHHTATLFHTSAPHHHSAILHTATRCACL